MAINSELREQSKVAYKDQKKLYQVIFGTEYIAEYLAILLVVISIVLAIFIPHEGLFWTSQSEGMNNFHRWLYDLFVLISSSMGIVLYFFLKRKMIQIPVRQQWKLYIQAQANLKKFRIQNAIQHGKKPLLVSCNSEIVAISIIIIILIMNYIFLTPSESSRRGDFWIQTWWPINAFIIGAFYYSLFWLYFRLLSVKDIDRQYRLIVRKEKLIQNKNNNHY